MKLKILITFSLLCYSGFAQMMITDILDPTGSNPAMQSGRVEQKNKIEDIFLTDWRVGYLFYGSKKEEKKLRYNAYKDAIHIIDSQGKEMVLEKGQVERFSVLDNGKEYKFKWVMDIPKINFGYLQEIYEGKVKVYYKHGRKLKQEISQTEGYAGNNMQEQFVSDDAFVIEMPNGTKYVTNARKKDILHIFGDRKKEIEEFIKTQKLDTQKLKDLMEVVKKYESFLG
ncbi:MAG: hypothetical protein ACK40K_01140 [Raineya sp.]